MVRGLLLSILAMVAGLLLAIALLNDPGYILIAYGDHTFETSLFVFLVVLLLLWLVLRLFMAILSWLNPRNWHR